MSEKVSMFEKVIIRTLNKDGWPIDFQLQSGTQPGPALEWLATHGYTPASSTPPGDCRMAEQSQAAGQFAAESLTATVDDGKAYWKVKGGSYQKFGVIVWPEVLEAAGFDVDNLNPLKPVDLTGWTAVYSVKENGQPQKVIKLAP